MTSHWIFKHLRQRAGLFGANRHGGIALNFAITFPALMIGVGAAIDYANLIKAKSRLQAAADTAAISSARELRLGTTNTTIINSVALNAAMANLGASAQTNTPSIAAEVLENGGAVQVSIAQDIASLMGNLLAPALTRVQVKAKARMVGGSPLCILALDANASKSIDMFHNAKVSAPGCAIIANSINDPALSSKSGNLVSAGVICSPTGTYAGPASGWSTPPTVCPAMKDPLAGIAPPARGAACGSSVTIPPITSGTVSLNPGTYCGGIQVSGGATVILNPGTYVLDNGGLSVSGSSILKGSGVGIYLTGANTQINLAAGPNTIDLSAAVTGDMPGILFFEDRSTTTVATHNFDSDQARNLAGTIYLPVGQFSASGAAPIADQSVYTVIVAAQFYFANTPNLVLNTNYSGSTIPVPSGVGPSAVALTN